MPSVLAEMLQNKMQGRKCGMLGNCDVVIGGLANVVINSILCVRTAWILTLPR